jgi:DNA-binding NarL/FixJ family response regulator
MDSSPREPSRLLIVDHHPFFRLGLRGMLERSGLFSGILEAGTGAEALALLRADPAIGLVILDLELPDMGGLELVEGGSNPATRTRFFVLAEEVGEVMGRRAITSGAVGFASRDIDPEGLLLALRLVLAGELFVDGGLLRQLLALDYARGAERDLAAGKLARLTARERETFDTLMTGLPAKAAAERLGVSLRTVENYQSAVYAKLEANSPVELVLVALKAGLLKP